MNDILKEYYYDEERGFSSAKTLYKRLKEDGHKFTLKQITEFIEKQLARQLTKETKKPEVYSSIVSPAVGNNYQIDLMIYDRYEFNHYKYILCVVDVYSRYVQVKALTSRQFPKIMENLKAIFKTMGIPNNINVDNEFNTNEFNKYCSDHNINVFYSLPDEINKNAIVERFNRTLAQLLQRWRIGTGKHDWVVALPKIINNYNSTIHSTINAKPKDVFDGKDINKQFVIRTLKTLKVGDNVRRKIVKQTFDKGDVIKNSKMIYTIVRIEKNKFYLEDEEGNELDRPFKEYELSKVGVVEYKPVDVDEEVIHIQTKRKKKIQREYKKEGIEEENISRKLRSRKPTNQLVHDKYGLIKY